MLLVRRQLASAASSSPPVAATASAVREAASATGAAPSPLMPTVIAKRPTLPHEALHAYVRDPAPRKANLTVGTYWNDHERLFTFETVRRARERVRSQDHDNNYTLQGGSERFRQLLTEFVLGGPDSAAYRARHHASSSYQTLGSCGALTLVAHLLHWRLGTSTIYVSQPFWPAYLPIFSTAGLSDIRTYRYLDNEGRLDIDGIVDDLNMMDEGSAVLFQVSSHNPTATDPVDSDWERICDAVAFNRHKLILDSAYHGYVSGDANRDLSAVRLVAERGVDFLLCQSFSKNLALYSDRIGALTVVVSNADELKALDDAIQSLVYFTYISPPLEPGLLIEEILSCDELRALWQSELAWVHGRLDTNRQQLHDLLQSASPRERWSRIVEQRGLFAFIDVKPEQVQRLLKEFSVYILPNGRINLSGLNPANIEHVASSIAAATAN